MAYCTRWRDYVGRGTNRKVEFNSREDAAPVRKISACKSPRNVREDVRESVGGSRISTGRLCETY